MQVVMITGASRGIGAATAALAAERGYAVCVNYRGNRDAAEGVVHGIRARGGTAVAVQADISVEADVARLFETCDRELGRVTALVNNAGVLERQQRVEAIDVERLQRVFATNVYGAFICAREAVLRMSTRRGGSGGAIVNVSSVAARLGAANEYVDYAASKGALDTLTVGLAHEVAGEGIRVNGVRAGYIYTDMHASGGEPNRVDRVKGSVAARRHGRGGGARHRLASVDRGVVHYGELHRGGRRTLKAPRASGPACIAACPPSVKDCGGPRPWTHGESARLGVVFLAAGDGGRGTSMVRFQYAALGLVVATLLAAQAAFWFVSGGYAVHPAVRSALVAVQLAISLAAAVGFVNRLRRQS